MTEQTGDETIRRWFAWARRAAVASSAICVVIGLSWSLRPSSMPFVGNARLYAEAVMPRPSIGPLLLLMGMIGVLAGVLFGCLPMPLLRMVAGGETAWLLIGCQGAGTIGALGYGAAYAVPLVAVVLAGLVVARSPRLRWPLVGVVVAVCLAGVVSGLLAPNTLGATYGSVVAVARANPFVGYVPMLLAAGVAWVAVLGLSSRSRLSASTGWVRRHRRLFAYGAALCSVPYGVARLLWLTPFQLESLLDLPGPPVQLDLRTRLWGVSLGLACLGGGVLITGLVSRWGEVFPHWLPWRAGRPVPVIMAAAPGFLVSAAFLAMTPTVVAGLVAAWPRSLLTAWILPFPAWGLLLSLAVWGYVAHRVGTPSVPVSSGTSAPPWRRTDWHSP